MPNKIALVTGASRGIGRACAIALAEAGFDVAVSARTAVDGTAHLEDGKTALPGGLDTTVAAIEGAGARGLAVPMDLLDRDSVLAAADRTLEHFGRIDLLLNNAVYQGPGAMQPLLELDESEMLRMFEGNVHAQLALTRHLLPGFIAQGGGIVMNMISATARLDPPGKIGQGGWGMAYAMTKAAFERVAPLLCIEHGDEGIVAYSIDPGHVTTEKMALTQKGRGFEGHFVGAPPEVIGAAVAWLATDPSAPKELAGQIVLAQREAKRRQLVEGWPPPR
jgi:NAD(P)-dependent dehydrogenase (short-subunit alcohol dehydrogenase family)